ncbi:MAG: hypothetical protein FWE35_12505 [Streptosporangiales bacterium]|jgi:hypothetical protein|nr:hypothetical protein [Streptosporangiales bacterium]
MPDDHERIYLEKLRLAVTVLLEAAEGPIEIPGPLETELFLLRDRLDRVLLQPGS